MKLKFSTAVCLLAILLIGLAGLAPRITTARQTNSNQLEERIRRVTNGLLPPITIKGQPPAPMNLDDRMRHYKVPGLSVAVIDNFSISWARGYGLREAGTEKRVTPDTLFQAASISKPVAATAALYLVEKGKLSLDEDVNAKLTSWKVPENDFTREQKVTLRRLMSHSAGLTIHGFPGYAADKPVPTVVQILEGEGPANTRPVRVDTMPGSKWRYSGGGYTVMQQLMIDVTGKTFPQLMSEVTLSKAGMRASAYEQPLPQARREQASAGHRPNGEKIKGDWHTYPEMAAAGLWTTPTDLARFAIEIQKSKAGKSNRILSKKMIDELLTPQSGDYGLGLGLEGKGAAQRFMHGGSNEGFRCFMMAYTELGKGIAVMTNSDNGDWIVQEIIRAVAREYGWPDYKPQEREATKVSAEILKAYAGQYQIAQGFSITITVEGDRVFAEATSQPQVEIVPETELKFFSLERPLDITFVKDASGKVNELTARLFNRNMKGIRVK